MPTDTGRTFTTANFLTNLAALKAINFGASDPAGVWFVVPNAITNNVEVWVWQPDSIAATDEISVIRPDSIVPGSPGRCIQRLKFDASQLGGILAAIAALTTAGLIERTTGGGAGTVAISNFIKTLLDDADQSTARTTLGLGAAATRAIGTSSGSVRDAADGAYTDARTPTTHGSTHAVGGTDPIAVFGYLAVSTNSTLTASNQRQLVDVNAVSAAITITLPSASSVGSGWAVQIRKSDSSANLVTISRSGSDTINGVTTLPIAVQHQSFILFSLGGTSWGVVAGFPGTLPANTLWGRGATAGPPEAIPSSNFASLVGGFVPASQIPGSYDDVLEFATLASFPTTGEAGKIYIAIDTNLTYRWTGSVYAGMSSSLALGTTSMTAYRGDFGNIAYNHSQIISGNPHGVTAALLNLGNLTNHLQVNTTETQTVGGDKTFSGIIKITNTTESTSMTTGCTVFSGGIGVSGNIYSGNLVYSKGGVIISDTHANELGTGYGFIRHSSGPLLFYIGATSPFYFKKGDGPLGNLIGINQDGTLSYLQTIPTGSGTTCVFSGGKIIALSSSRESKENIRSLEVREDILDLIEPKTFNYIGQDPLKRIAHGFIVEDLELVEPSLITYEKGKAYSIQHSELVAVLWREVQKLKRIINYDNFSN